MCILLPYMGASEFGGQGQWLKVLLKDESYEMALQCSKFLKTNTSMFKAFQQHPVRSGSEDV